MAHGCGRECSVVFVAGIALSCGRNVRDWFCQGILRNIRATVASRAIARCAWPCGAGMAHRGRREGGVVFMAGVALRRGRNMRARFSQGRGAVMAG